MTMQTTIEIEVSKTCLRCEQTYTRKGLMSQKKWEQRKYCSPYCGNKGKSCPQLKGYCFKKGNAVGEQTRFKNGQTAGANNAKWKGDKASYAAKHIWVKYHFGSPQGCERCGIDEKRMYHWANISGQYKRERDDWERLCVPCHKRTDLARLSTSKLTA